MSHNNGGSTPNDPSPKYTILWSTQGGRAKACARRTARILRDAVDDPLSSDDNGNGNGNSSGDAMVVGTGYYGSSFDDYGALEILKLGMKGGSEECSNGGTVKSDDEVKLVILFVSTTGDAEHCDSIRDTWKTLLQKSLPKTQFRHMRFALFCLGDRAYGPNAFCAAGRKLAARLVQLGAAPYCKVGYGDDGTPNGGVFRDLDSWLEEEFLVRILGGSSSRRRGGGGKVVRMPQSPYRVDFINRRVRESSSSSAAAAAANDDTDGQIIQEWQKQPYRDAYNVFFQSQCPATAYRYSPNRGTRIDDEDDTDGTLAPVCDPPLLAHVTSNTRITAKGWVQDTRHISIHVTTNPPNAVQPRSSIGTSRKKGKAVVTNGAETEAEPQNNGIGETEGPTTMADNPLTVPLPYAAGDIATILPSNSKSTVRRFISYLPRSLQRIADEPITVNTLMMASTQYASSFTPWPRSATLRGILTYCADIVALPEREDLRSLSVYCNPKHPMGNDQRNKLVSMSETEDAALYGDYIIREKRDWSTVLFDFDSIRFEGEGNLDDDDDNNGGRDTPNPNLLTIDHLLLLLPPIMPRHFSIASAPSNAIVKGHEHGYTHDHGNRTTGFDFELCVAVVEGETRHKRKFCGLCSGYLSHLRASSNPTVRVWIRPGSFGKLPREIVASYDGGGVDGVEEKSCRRSHRFKTPIMCIGAGTGVAPLRSLIQEREAIFTLEVPNDDDDDPVLNPTSSTTANSARQESTGIIDNVLVFGCRKSTADYYYESEWEEMEKSSRLRLLTAFSQDQKHKIYVQRLARETDSGSLIAKHIVENSGAVYVAGGAKMARAVREEIVECLGKVLPGGERDAKLLIKKLQRIGKFSVEAWS